MTVRINLRTDEDASLKLKSDSVNIMVPTYLSDLINDNNTVTDPDYVHTDNNFTDALLTKLDDIDDSADVNAIEHITVNDVEQTITNKTVDIAVVEGTTNGTIKIAGTDVAVHGLGSAAYANTDDLGEDNVIEIVKVNGIVLTPDSNRAVNVQVPTAVTDLSDAANYATQSYVTTAIGNANHLQSVLVTALPASGETNILYLVPDDGGKNNKDMYIWDATNSQFVLVGNTEVDLTGYAVESQFSVATSAQIQALFAT